MSVAISPGLSETTLMPFLPYSKAHFAAYQHTKFFEMAYANPAFW